jgi:hypothetical protein
MQLTIINWQKSTIAKFAIVNSLPAGNYHDVCIQSRNTMAEVAANRSNDCFVSPFPNKKAAPNDATL